MSIAHAVAHGAFGRACLYELDRPMVPHAHREGHLIFHVSGPVASVVIWLFVANRSGRAPLSLKVE